MGIDLAARYTIRSGCTRYVVRWALDLVPEGEVRVLVPDLASARAFLRPLLSDPANASVLRALAMNGRGCVRPQSDADSVELLAIDLVSGRFVISELPQTRYPMRAPPEQSRRREEVPWDEAGALPDNDWLEVELIDDTGRPVAGEPYRITTPNGSTRHGVTDAQGIVRLTRIPSGVCKVSFPRREQGWS